MLDGEVVPPAGGALVFAEAWAVVVTSASEGNLGRLGVGFKWEVTSTQSGFQTVASAGSTEQYFSKHLESAGILSATVSQSLPSDAAEQNSLLRLVGEECAIVI